MLVGDMADRWDHQAACRGSTPDLWFPPESPSGGNLWIRGKRVCARCPVARECLDESVRDRVPDGMWGGVGADRRRWLQAVRAAVPWKVWVRVRDRELWEVQRWAGLDVGPVPLDPQRRCWRCESTVPEGRHPVDRNGPGSTCGKVSTYNKGCRCLTCVLAKRDNDRRGRRDPAGGNVVAGNPDPQKENHVGTVTELERETVNEGDEVSDHGADDAGPVLTDEQAEVIRQVWEQTAPIEMSIFRDRGVDLDGVTLDWPTAARLMRAGQQMEAGSQLWLGDIANAVEETYGDQLWNLVDPRYLPEPKTLVNYQYVARRIPSGPRLDNERWSSDECTLRYSHLRYAADLPEPEDRVRLLDRAFAERLTSRQVQDIVRAMNRGQDMDEATEEATELDVASTGTWTLSFTLPREHAAWGNRIQDELEQELSRKCAAAGIEPTKVTPSRSGAATAG